MGIVVPYCKGLGWVSGAWGCANGGGWGCAVGPHGVGLLIMGEAHDMMDDGIRLILVRDGITCLYVVGRYWMGLARLGVAG